MEKLQEWLSSLASEIMGCENVNDRAGVAFKIADKLEELGFKESAEEVRTLANEWMDQGE